LETERDKLLREEEEKWRLRSRAVWLKSGDKNTKFFHNFASYRRNKKQIWEICDEEGQLHTGVEAIKSEAVKLFKSFYRKSEEEYIEDQVNTVGLFGCLVNAEDTELLERPCTKQELWEVLKAFSKDKIPGPDGWTVEFYLYFFDLMGDDLLDLVEDSRLRGAVKNSLNATFLTLIPKVNKPSSFGITDR
jgi:hypothetical protein